ncbi:MAG: NAD(P)-binding domain-containing protein [Candidatus Dormibacteraeota bacterium]|nr:NAD(P)-binding domain-containing protein [Candidatus Dormibacteraeota bacterium]
MAELADRPFPPGPYRLVVVGSGPGALQLSYSLRRLGIDHAVISEDPAPGGMFRRWPIFQRMLSWTKPHTLVPRGSRAYERFDWNSLLADEPDHQSLMAGIMDGSSYFPSRPEMEQGLARFAGQTGIQVRYGCRWESTRREGADFVLTTSDGEYRAGAVTFAVGVAQPYRPPIPGLEQVAHYGDFRPVETYADRRVFIVGKQNSGFEIATGLLPWARQIVLASPSPTRLSVNTHSLVGVRARYVQPYEDAALAGGVVILDAAIEEVAARGGAMVVRTRNAHDGRELCIEADDVIAATGFTAPLRDLPALGVTTYGQSRLPAQTPFWESASVPGLYFAGTLSQGSAGLKKHGIPSNSGAVQGHRYNARVLARHLATTRFGVEAAPPRVAARDVVRVLLDEATCGPEVWHQRSYLTRVIAFQDGTGITDEGIVPLQHFVDASGPNAVAITLESNGQGDPYPAVYVRHKNRISEHLLAPHPLLHFDGDAYTREVEAILEPVLKETAPLS